MNGPAFRRPPSSGPLRAGFMLALVWLAAIHPPAQPPPRPHTRVGAGAGAGRPVPSLAARQEIPAAYLALYRASAVRVCPGLPWAVLAGIGRIETNHGRSRAPGVRSGVNRFGCCAGPMQFNVRNGPPSTWDAYGRRGDVYDPRDAIPAAARLLCANGAASGRHLRRAIYAYNHAGWYVAAVLAHARRYAHPR